MDFKCRKNRGITLIVLVVTVIILIILAGVTISSLTGENGIIKQAGLAKQMSLASSEKEAIQLDITLAEMENKLDSSNKYYIGTPLYDKTLENGNKWNIVVENETQKTYGTGWTLIDKGTNISNYGKTDYSWVVNYDSGEVKQINDSEYTRLEYGSNLAVKDGLILNIDPINMSDSTSWGDNVKMYGVQDGDGYGWNGNEIKFDGIDDYIEVYNNFEMTEGMTFEFYGKGDDFDTRMLSKTIKNGQGWATRFRTHFLENYNRFMCCMSDLKSNSDWAVPDNEHWIQKENLSSFKGSTGNYITMVVDLTQNTIALYQKGIKVGRTTCSADWLTKGGLTDNSIPFVIGLMVGGSTYTESYSKMSLYACRLYNKVLTDDEVKANYNQTVAYHNMLINQK